MDLQPEGLQLCLASQGASLGGAGLGGAGLLGRQNGVVQAGGDPSRRNAGSTQRRAASLFRGRRAPILSSSSS